MEQITVLLQNDIITVRDSMLTMQRECADIYDAYWKTDANTTVTALTSTGIAATVESNLTKGDYINGITFAENLEKFFSNQAVSQADYLQTIDQIKYGNANLGSQLTVATESIGTRIKQLCLDALEVYKQTLDIVDMYFDNEVGDTVGVLDADRIIYGCEMTRTDLSNAITMFQQYHNMIQNSAVAQGDYSATLTKLVRLSTIE